MKQALTALAALAATALGACTQQRQPGTDVEQRIDSLMAQMTIEEKVALCHAQSKFTSPGVPRLGVPELHYSDGPHGVRAEINWDDWGYAGWSNDSCTAFPALTALASTFNPDLAFAYGDALGEESLYRGKDVILGPGVNIYRTPLNGRNFEYMGEDPYLASVMVVPYVKGVQRHGVATSVKHFALNNQELWRGHINVEVSDRALREIYLPAFRAAVVEGGAWTVMGAYNKLRGQHCCHNELLINKILKGEWAFDGAVITDWGGAHDTREAALNGLDIEMGSWTNGLTSSMALAYDNYYLARPYLDALRKGELPMSTLDDKVRRILRLMFRTSMSRRTHGIMGGARHSATARAVADEGIVLLKNSGGFFPLDTTTQMTIAVIGQNATRCMTLSGGSSELKARYEVSPLEGIRAQFPQARVVYSMGYAGGPSAYGREIPSPLDADSLLQAAVETARTADVVIFVGGLNKSHLQDCEAGDRVSLGLPFGQDRLIGELKAANPRLGVVLVSGNAVAMPWVDSVDGIVQAWYLGSEAGHAIADVLSGRVNPSGKLPITFPVALQDVGAHSFGSIAYPGDSINEKYLEDILVGYRWHDTRNIRPLFAFGHGLSYTTFALSNVSTQSAQCSANQTIKLTATLANTGNRSGAEVVQVYVGKPDSKVARAAKELKAFGKYRLDAGQSATISIDLPAERLAYFDEGSQQWTVEPGAYDIMVGTTSDNIADTLRVDIR